MHVDDDPLPPFFTDDELCERWKCSHMKLWRLRSQGKLPKPFKLGGPRSKNLTSGGEVRRVEEGSGSATS
jgi:hypothetical protein